MFRILLVVLALVWGCEDEKPSYESPRDRRNTQTGGGDASRGPSIEDARSGGAGNGTPSSSDAEESSEGDIEEWDGKSFKGNERWKICYGKDFKTCR